MRKHFNWLNFLPGGLDTSIAKNGWMMQWYQSNVRFANGAFISVLWLENRSAASAALLDEKKQTFEFIKIIINCTDRLQNQEI